MEYDIIHSNTYDGLKLCVKDAIERGWRPQGGVAVFVQEGDMFLLQAVVKKHRAVATQGKVQNNR